MSQVFYANTEDWDRLRLFGRRWPWRFRVRQAVRLASGRLHDWLTSGGFLASEVGPERPRVYRHVVWHEGRFWNLVEGGAFPLGWGGPWPDGWDGGPVLTFMHGTWHGGHVRRSCASDRTNIAEHRFVDRRRAEEWLRESSE